jgi:hypothetical protein
VRAELARSAADVPVGDLRIGVHERAGRIRQRRRFVAGVVVGAAAAAVVATAVIVPVVTAGPPPSQGPAGVGTTAPAPDATSAPTTPTPSGPATAATGNHPTGTAPATPWGAVTLDESFVGLDRSRWTAYDGPGDQLGRWSPGNVAVDGGKLRLSVGRPGGNPASTWGGIGASGDGQRYGRWETQVRMSVGRGVIGQFLLNPTGGDPAIVVSVSPFTGTIAVSGTATGGGDPQVKPLPRPSDAHVVAVEWTPQAVRVLVDNVRLFEWTGAAPTAPLWPALQAIMAGPDCGAVPLPADCQGTTTTFPQHLEADYLRVLGYRG